MGRVVRCCVSVDRLLCKNLRFTRVKNNVLTLSREASIRREAQSAQLDWAPSEDPKMCLSCAPDRTLSVAVSVRASYRPTKIDVGIDRINKVGPGIPDK